MYTYQTQTGIFVISTLLKTHEVKSGPHHLEEQYGTVATRGRHLVYNHSIHIAAKSPKPRIKLQTA